MHDNWIYKEIRPYVQRANSLAGWNFQWQQIREHVNLLFIQKASTMVGIKIAGMKLIKPLETLQGKIRKLSMTVSLSDQKEYSGGNLEFDFRAISKNKPSVCKEINSKGFSGSCVSKFCMASSYTRNKRN